MLRPDQYACAINLFGLMDLPGLMREYSFTRESTTFVHWQTACHWNDYSDEELDRFTPVNRVDEIRAPLLVIESTDAYWGGRYGLRYLGVEDLVRALRRQDKEVVAINYDSQEYADDRSVQKTMFREIAHFLAEHLTQ